MNTRTFHVIDSEAIVKYCFYLRSSFMTTVHGINLRRSEGGPDNDQSIGLSDTRLFRRSLKKRGYRSNWERPTWVASLWL